MNRVFEAKVVSKSIVSLENNSQFTKFHFFPPDTHAHLTGSLNLSNLLTLTLSFGR